MSPRFALALGLVFLTAMPVMAAPFDGRWSVLLVTETGACDVYRLSVQVVNGRIVTAGEGPQVQGTVTSRGAVDLRVRYGDEAASATGEVLADVGRGRWNATSRKCAGRWQAEKRS